MLRRNLALSICLILISTTSQASDFGHHVPDDSYLESSLENSKAVGDQDPYLSGVDHYDHLSKDAPLKEEDLHPLDSQKLTEKQLQKRDVEDFGYVPMGAEIKNTSYEKIDKTKMANNFRTQSSGALTLTYFNNDYDYLSDNNIINETTESGFHSGKGGTVHVRNDSYLSKHFLANTFWSASLGIGYSTGKGFFTDGTRSDATLNLWQLPVELGLGLEIPISSWFKISASGGGGVFGLVQNRSDFQRGEKGKRKIQVSPGYYGNAQFKINLTGFNDNLAYDIFTSSEITNIFLNLEARYQSYEKFQDSVSITGTSFGAGLTFEYL